MKNFYEKNLAPVNFEIKGRKEKSRVSNATDGIKNFYEQNMAQVNLKSKPTRLQI